MICVAGSLLSEKWEVAQGYPLSDRPFSVSAAAPAADDLISIGVSEVAGCVCFAVTGAVGQVKYIVSETCRRFSAVSLTVYGLVKRMIRRVRRVSGFSTRKVFCRKAAADFRYTGVKRL